MGTRAQQPISVPSSAGADAWPSAGPAVTIAAWSPVSDAAPTSLWTGAAEIPEKPPSYLSIFQVLAERAPATSLAARLPPCAARNADRGEPRHPGRGGAHD